MIKLMNYVRITQMRIALLFTAENKYLPSSPMQPASGDCNGKSSTEYAQPLDLSAEQSHTLEVSEHPAVLTSAANVEEEKTGENSM